MAKISKRQQHIKEFGKKEDQIIENFIILNKAEKKSSKLIGVLVCGALACSQIFIEKLSYSIYRECKREPTLGCSVSVLSTQIVGWGILYISLGLGIGLQRMIKEREIPCNIPIKSDMYQAKRKELILKLIASLNPAFIPENRKKIYLPLRNLSITYIRDKSLSNWNKVCNMLDSIGENTLHSHVISLLKKQ